MKMIFPYSPIKFVAFILITLSIILPSCNTTQQATKCPTFKQKKQKRTSNTSPKMTKKVRAYKTVLAEKYRQNRIEKEKVNVEFIAPIKSIENGAIASIDEDFIIEKRKDYNVFEKQVQKERKTKTLVTSKPRKNKFKNSNKLERFRKKRIRKQTEVPKGPKTRAERARIGGILGVISFSLIFLPYLSLLCLPLSIVSLIMVVRNSERRRYGVIKTGLIMASIVLGFFGIAIWFLTLLIGI